MPFMLKKIIFIISLLCLVFINGIVVFSLPVHKGALTLPLWIIGYWMFFKYFGEKLLKIFPDKVEEEVEFHPHQFYLSSQKQIFYTQNIHEDFAILLFINVENIGKNLPVVTPRMLPLSNFKKSRPLSLSQSNEKILNFIIKDFTGEKC